LDPQRACDLEQPRVVAHGVAVAREHDGLRVVEEPLPRDATEVEGGAHERAAKRLDRQIEDELGPHGARVGEHHHEDPEWAQAAGDVELAHVGPVHLRLLADEALDPQEHLAARHGPHLGHVAAQDRDAAFVAAPLDHVEEPGRAQARMQRERLVDEAVVGIDEARPRRDDERPLGAPIEHAVDHVGVHAKLGDDRAALPLFGVVKTPDLVLLGELDRHGVTPSMHSWRSSAKSPKPWIRRPRRGRAGNATSTS